MSNNESTNLLKEGDPSTRKESPRRTKKRAQPTLRASADPEPDSGGTVAGDSTNGLVAHEHEIQLAAKIAPDMEAGWDKRLNELVGAIGKRLYRMRRAAEVTVLHHIRLGDHLNEARNLCNHGEWKHFLEKCRLKSRFAQQCMRFADSQSIIMEQAHGGAHFTVDSVRKLIASPKKAPAAGRRAESATGSTNKGHDSRSGDPLTLCIEMIKRLKRELALVDRDDRDPLETALRELIDVAVERGLIDPIDSDRERTATTTTVSREMANQVVGN
jgi:hypothetical protein